MRYIQSYYTDIGVKRTTNQDSLALIKADTDFGEVLLALVCDGMGGHQSGEIASKVIIKKFSKWFKESFPIILYEEFSFEELRIQWKLLINECNRVLVDYGRKNNIEMGSTVTAFLFVKDQYYVAHVGDSRGYKINNNALQITDDHSFLAEEVRKGNMTREEAKRDKRKNILVECVGITPTVKIEFYSGDVNKKDCFIICSDGFWHYLENDEFVRYLKGSQFSDNKKMRMHLNYLVDLVKQRGEKDNISVIGVVAV